MGFTDGGSIGHTLGPQIGLRSIELLNRLDGSCISSTLVPPVTRSVSVTRLAHCF